MLKTHAVGIDLGTTYSCIAHLNEHGEPVSITNEEGEISTPSVVLYDKGEEVVGTEALRNAIMNPTHVVQNAKRSIGDPHKKWQIDGDAYTPIDVSASILRKLLRDAERHIGKTDRAVITVPAQFGDTQRRATVEAGHKAGLKQVDIINEPVAAALCHVLGSEGLWFTELAEEQRILVYDLGGGTFDLSLVKYQRNEVQVIASSGDLHLGGIDWNNVLLNYVADQFSREFGEDPRSDLESLQHLAWEVEQCKRSLTVRPRAGLLCQHGGKRKTYQIEQQKFEELTKPFVLRTEELTQKLLKDNKLGWARVDVVLSTGGSSRMPMIRETLRRMSGRTLNTSLSPDQSIAHGATYYAGMILSNNEFVHSILTAEASQRLAAVKQQSVNARALGVLVRNMKTNRREPHYLIPANSPLPVSITENFATVIAGQKRVRLRIVESGPASDPEKFVLLGTCQVDGLPRDLPADAPVEVTIKYDESACVQVSARDVTTGKEAATQIIRSENVVQRGLEAGGVASPTNQGGGDSEVDDEVVLKPVTSDLKSTANQKPSAAKPVSPADPAPKFNPTGAIPASGQKPGLKPAAVPLQRPAAAVPARPAPSVIKKSPAPVPMPPGIKPGASASASQLSAPGQPLPLSRPPVPGKPASGPPSEVLDSRAELRALDSSEIMELPSPTNKLAPGERRPLKPPASPKKPKNKDAGEQEFWELVDE